MAVCSCWERPHHPLCAIWAATHVPWVMAEFTPEIQAERKRLLLKDAKRREREARADVERLSRQT